ncbi:MAG: hypothetical protein LBB51_03575 [Zoogloeaceae bacterium]|jgi:hypothetical protein|nr:hypothetical protein [Zoogloeaceae bacterium]
MSTSFYENAAAIFTYADSPFVLNLLTALVAILILFALIATIRHENHSYKLPDEDRELKKLKGKS